MFSTGFSTGGFAVAMPSNGAYTQKPVTIVCYGDFITIQIGPETFQFAKAELKRRVNGTDKQSYDFIKTQMVDRLAMLGTDMDSDTAIKSALEGVTYKL